MTRLTYNPTAWGPAPRKLDVEGHQVRLEGFHTLDRRTVSLTGPSGDRMIMLVIPADTTELRGNAVLAKACAGPDSVSSPEDLLADGRTSDSTTVSSALPPPAPPAETSYEARWETEGGHLLSADQTEWVVPHVRHEG